jgi:hypothetical protein
MDPPHPLLVPLVSLRSPPRWRVFRRPFIVRFCSFGPGCFAWAEIPSISRASTGRPAIPLIQRHRENEPRFIRGGGHVNPSAMCLRDLRGDMQAKA